MVSLSYHKLKKIESDGFRVYEQIKIEMPEDSLYATSQAIGSGGLLQGP